MLRDLQPRDEAIVFVARQPAVLANVVAEGLLAHRVEHRSVKWL